jgi:hypothetical protein
MYEAGELVVSTDGSVMAWPPRRCATGHLLAGAAR